MNVQTVNGIARKDYAAGTVTTAAYTTLVASLGNNANMLEIYDGSAQSLVLAVGAAGSEVNKIYIVPGGNGKVPIQLRAGDRISIKAISANATSGELLVNFYG